MELQRFLSDVDQYKQVVRQKLKVREFDDYNLVHVRKLNEYVDNLGLVAPGMIEYPWKWFEAFHGWEFLAKFGRPSAMALQPYDYKTVRDYVIDLGISKKYRMVLIDQIIKIDHAFVKSNQKTD